MSGVRCGSRLEQLETLARRLQHEIAQERRRLALDDRPTDLPQPATAPRAPAPDPTALPPLPDPVTAPLIRQWALAEGLIDRIARGRVPRELTDAFYDAHRPAGGTQ